MNATLHKLTAMLAVFALLTGAIGAAAAVPAWDTETTNTATTSDVDGTTTSIDVYYGDSGNYTFFEISGADTSTNYTLEITPAQDGVDYVVYQNTSMATTDGTNGHYGFNVSHDELADAPRDVDGASYDVSIINQSSGKEELNATGVTFANAGKNPKAVMVLTNETTNAGAAMSPLVADRLEISTESAGFFSLSTFNVFGNDSDDETTIATWSGYTTVDGTNTTVDVQLDNSSAADAYAAAAEDREDGDWITTATLFVNGIPQQVYLNEAPEDADGTTVVYDDSAEKLVIDTEGDDYKDVRTLQLRGAAGQNYGFGELWSNFGALSALESLYPF